MLRHKSPQSIVGPNLITNKKKYLVTNRLPFLRPLSSVLLLIVLVEPTPTFVILM